MTDNPRAFPSQSIDDKYGGMTLRDWFATHAPEPPTIWWGNGPVDCTGLALWNYQYADAMLRQRDKP